MAGFFHHCFAVSDILYKKYYNILHTYTCVYIVEPFYPNIRNGSRNHLLLFTYSGSEDLYLSETHPKHTHFIYKL